MKTLLTLLLTTLLFGEDITSIVKESVKKNYSLQSIHKRIEAAKLFEQRADNLDDPMVAIGANDVRLDQPFSRSLEPMQTHFISISQKFPAPNKRKLDKTIAKSQTMTLMQELSVAKEYIALQLYLAFADYFKAKKQLLVIDQLLPLVQKNSRYLASMMIFGTNKHLILIKNNILADKIGREKIDLKKKIYTALRKIEALAQKKIDSIDLYLPILKSRDIQNNSKLRLLMEKATLQQVKTKRAKLDEKSDYTVGIGYYQRSDFRDYVSLSLKFNLPIYGTERIRYQEEKKQYLALQLQIKDLLEKLHSQTKSLQNEITKLQENLKILEQKTLPSLRHFFSITLAQAQSGKDLYGYLDMLEERYYLELEAISLQSKIFKKKATLAYLTGAFK